MRALRRPRPPVLAVSLVLAALLATSSARAAEVLVVLDSGADMGIAMALEADGHTVTVDSGSWAAGSNPALTGDLSAYDVIFWSQDGPSFGEAVTDSALITNLTDYVMGGGRILVTGYDSVASPDDPMLYNFLGATSAADVVGAPGAVAFLDNSLTNGVVDIRGVVPTGGVSDTDHMNGLMADTVEVTPSMRGPGSQWILRTLGSGEIAYISNGKLSPSWTDTSAGGAGAYNAAIRNFAGAASTACVGEGMACTSSGGAMGTCRSGRCCTGCWDGARCRAGISSVQCGIDGALCATCADSDLCTSDICVAGLCSNPDAPMGTVCDDSVFCTRTDRCNGLGLCMGSGARCDDSETCTVDSCNEAMDRCVNMGMADLTACTAGAAVGVCRLARCCAGCFDGAVCQPGTAPAACGVGGTACSSCVDGVDCSRDVCTAGVCSNPDAASGTVCNDGMYCTPMDRCNATRTCIGSGVRCDDGASCTIDTCDEGTDMCVYTPGAGCIIGGVCVIDGTVNPSYPCLVCDSTRSGTDWSPAAVGTDCGTRCGAGRITERSCDDTGVCVPGTVTRCPTGVCEDGISCAAGCTAGGCGAMEWCNPMTGACQTLGAAGAACTMAAACASGVCADGVCCNDTCDGTCESCDLAGFSGTCSPYGAGSDPEAECGSATCNGAGACSGTDAGPMRLDGGGPDTDGGAGADSGPRVDAGTTERMTRRSGGCGCTAPGRADGAPALVLFGLGVLALVFRRRRF